MVARLTGNDAVSARRLASETGLRQQTLSRWLPEASSSSPHASEALEARVVDAGEHDDRDPPAAGHRLVV
jgi:hypothetical protein